MHPPHPDSEAALENNTIALFSQLQWEIANCYHETFGTNSTLGRETKGEVVLIPKLQSALQNLNPDLPPAAIQLAIEELTRDRSTLSLANGNAEIYQLLIEKNVRAKSGEHLKQLLQEDHRYIFTMIQKFRTEKGETYPQLSDRSDIIVIADEAHRSQYDTFAFNMRNALPNAAFVGDRLSLKITILRTNSRTNWRNWANTA